MPCRWRLLRPGAGRIAVTNCTVVTGWWFRFPLNARRAQPLALGAARLSELVLSDFLVLAVAADDGGWGGR
jgi:hypothetical protein